MTKDDWCLQNKGGNKQRTGDSRITSMTNYLDLVNICETYKSGEDETITRKSGIIYRYNNKFLGSKAHYEYNRYYRYYNLKERVGKSKPRLRRG